MNTNDRPNGTALGRWCPSPYLNARYRRICPFCRPGVPPGRRLRWATPVARIPSRCIGHGGQLLGVAARPALDRQQTGVGIEGTAHVGEAIMRWVRKAGHVSDGRRSWRSRRARRVCREPVEEQSLNGRAPEREISKIYFATLDDARCLPCKAGNEFGAA
jgi:hypothetical protein